LELIPNKALNLLQGDRLGPAIKALTTMTAKAITTTMTMNGEVLFTLHNHFPWSTMVLIDTKTVDSS